MALPSNVHKKKDSANPSEESMGLSLNRQGVKGSNNNSTTASAAMSSEVKTGSASQGMALSGLASLSAIVLSLSFAFV